MATTREVPVYVPPRPRPPTGARADAEIARVRTLAKVLDHGFIDPILGLILPGVGDLAGSMLGLYTVAVAIRRRMSPVVIARMLLNLALDAAIGVVPVVGDLFDLGWKANQRNATLLAEHTDRRASARDWLAVIGAALAFCAAIAVVVAVLVAVIGKLV